jgi:chemotaxis protein MotB
MTTAFDPFADAPERLRKPAPGWMITFADLLSLLLAFFVMMFATTTIDRKAWREDVQPIARYFGTRAQDKPQAVVTPPAAPAPEHAAEYVAALLEHLTDTAASLKGATLRRHNGELTLRLPVDVVAPSTLSDLGRLVAGLDNRVDVRVTFSGDGLDVPAPHWTRAMQAAQSTAAALSKLASGRPIGALAAVDPGVASMGPVTEFVIYDHAVETRDAAP